MLGQYSSDKPKSERGSGCKLHGSDHFCLFRIPPTAAVLARLPSLKAQEKKKPSIKPSGGVLSFLHRLRPGRGTGLNRVANQAPSTSWPSSDSHNAWQALSETSGSEDAKVRSVLACLTAWNSFVGDANCAYCSFQNPPTVLKYSLPYSVFDRIVF